MLRRQFVAGSISALATASAWSASSRAQNQVELDALIAAAKKEGRVVFYNSQTAFDTPTEVGKLFEAKYGIKVEQLQARGAELMERIRVEGTNNKVAGDLILVGATGTVPLSRANLLAPPDQVPNVKRLSLAPWAKEDVPIYVVNYGLCINTDLVKAADEPKSWKDLLNPKWKGKIIADEMTIPSNGSTWFAVMLDAFGQEFHDQMAKQDIHFTRITPDKPKRVALGEFAIGIPFGLQELKNYPGLPIKGIVPQEGAPYTPVSASVIKDAPHPNAAKLLMNFFLEPDTQLMFIKSGYPVSTPGLTSQVPPEWRVALDAKLLGHANIDKQEERLQLAGKIYNRK
jgi:iron(III) transport system substrate-binding protein